MPRDGAIMVATRSSLQKYCVHYCFRMKFGRDVTLMVLQCRTIWRHRQGVDGVDHNSCLRDCLSFVLLPRTFLDEAITARSSCK